MRASKHLISARYLQVNSLLMHVGMRGQEEMVVPVPPPPLLSRSGGCANERTVAQEVKAEAGMHSLSSATV